MNHIAPPHEPLIREVPLSRLALAPENVRKTPADPVAEAEMKASIAAHGLLENLTVYRLTWMRLTRHGVI